MYADVARPLTRLISAFVPFTWSHEESSAFKYLKKRLTEAPVLIAPNWSITFHVHTDASLTAVGAVLTQPHIRSRTWIGLSTTPAGYYPKLSKIIALLKGRVEP